MLVSTSVYVKDVVSVVVVVVVTPDISDPVVVTIPTEVETPLIVDAGSTVTGVETVLI